MLRSNSKKARENMREYIISNFHPENYVENDPEDFASSARLILDVFNNEYGNKWNRKQYPNDQERFINWCQCLPSVIDTCYYYNRSAVDDLAKILEETEEEKSRFSEEQAEYRLSALIYMELLRGAKR